MKLSLIKSVGIILSMTVCTVTYSATLEAANYVAQVQVEMRNGSVDGCGVVLGGFEAKTSGMVNVFNGSVMVYSNGAGLVKSRISQVNAANLYAKNFSLSNLKPVKASNIWLKAKNSKATSPMTGIHPSDDPSYSIYISDSTVEILSAILEEAEFQIGFKLDNSKSGSVMFGKAEISSAERSQLMQCLHELVVEVNKNSPTSK